MTRIVSAAPQSGRRFGTWLRSGEAGAREASAAATPIDSEALLVVRDLTVRYGNTADARAACQSISFELRSQERVTLLGPTGCGKSTLLKAIAGFLPISEGEILLSGQLVRRPSQSRFVVFQEFDQLFPWQRIRSNIIYAIRAADRRSGQRRRSSAAAREAAEHYLEIVGLAGRGDLYPAECSGGMKQRVALARALAVSPNLLLLDEPFGALDAQTRTRLQELLLEVSELTKVSMLFVTHDIGEAILLGNRIMMMSARGELVSIFDSPSALGDHDERALREAALAEDLRKLLVRTP